MSEKSQIILACIIGLSICLYYLYKLRQNEANYLKEKRKSLIDNQKNKLDSVLISLGYKKITYKYVPNNYISKIVRRELKGEIIEYFNLNLQKRICLFFDMTYGGLALLKTIYLFQNINDETEAPDFVNFKWLQRDKQLFFNNTNSLNFITAKQILKVFNTVGAYHKTKDCYHAKTNYSKMESSAYLYLKNSFAYLEEDYGFSEVYYSGDYPNYFEIFQNIVVFKKGDIEVIANYYSFKNEWELSAIICAKDKEERRFDASFYSKNKEEVLEECKKYLVKNYC